MKLFYNRIGLKGVDQGRPKKLLTSFAGSRTTIFPGSWVWASDCREDKSDVSSSVSLILGREFRAEGLILSLQSALSIVDRRCN
jgi:hypothetical protein